MKRDAVAKHNKIWKTTSKSKSGNRFGFERQHENTERERHTHTDREERDTDRERERAKRIENARNQEKSARENPSIHPSYVPQYVRTCRDTRSFQLEYTHTHTHTQRRRRR